jgi:2-polyprenyl-3-methyl-5-hydroxy-6-metoxy-1,4-benzoquinol methylase
MLQKTIKKTDACPICRNEKDKLFRCKTTLNFGTEFDLIECEECGVLYFHPMPRREELESFYTASYYDFERHKHEGKGMAFAKKYLDKKTGKFLDVGCATGFFINGIRASSDWEVFGVDFGKAAVKFASEELGLNVVAGDLTETDYPDQFFDFVHINNVLEHVLKPTEVLSECRRIIKPDGTMYLSVPNGFVDSRDLIRFYESEKIPARSKSGHIFFFPSRTLLKIIKDAGFMVEKTSTYGIRRGMRSLGWLPQKPKWKTPYFPQKQSEIDRDAVTLKNKKKHSDYYYQYRFAQLNMKMLPGLSKIGLDYQFILRPAN